MYCLFIAADSIVDRISFIRHIQKQGVPNPDSTVDPAGFEFPNPARSGSGRICNINQIQDNLSSSPQKSEDARLPIPTILLLLVYRASIEE